MCELTWWSIKIVIFVVSAGSSWSVGATQSIEFGETSQIDVHTIEVIASENIGNSTE